MFQCVCQNVCNEKKLLLSSLSIAEFFAIGVDLKLLYRFHLNIKTVLQEKLNRFILILNFHEVLHSIVNLE